MQRHGPGRKLNERERLTRIHYNLSMSDSQDLESRLVLVIAPLPKPMAEYALEHRVFPAIGVRTTG